MKIARVFIQEYPGRQIGDIHDVFDLSNHPGVLLSGVLQEVEVDDNFDKDVMTATLLTEKWIKEGEQDVYAQPEIEDPENPGQMIADESWSHQTGSFIVFQVDSEKESAKVQSARNDRLYQFRSIRDEKLKAVDIMVNELQLGIRADTVAVRDYRQALLDATEPYRWANDPNRAKAAVDGLDIENFSWPVEPTI